MLAVMGKNESGTECRETGEVEREARQRDERKPKIRKGNQKADREGTERWIHRDSETKESEREIEEEDGERERKR